MRKGSALDQMDKKLGSTEEHRVTQHG